MSKTGRTSEWFCINEACKRCLGHVLGGEFQPEENITGQFIQTRGPNLVVKCPDCGTIKIWYTADPITRAIYQLVDAIATQGAKRMLHKFSEMTLDRKE